MKNGIEQPMTKPANPSAFPSEYRYGGHAGMTLRDWFAGQALVGVITRNKIYLNGLTGQWKEAAEQAYATADAMLEARGE